MQGHYLGAIDGVVEASSTPLRRPSDRMVTERDNNGARLASKLGNRSVGGCRNGQLAAGHVADLGLPDAANEGPNGRRNITMPSCNLLILKC
jgi:hypothetical protein